MSTVLKPVLKGSAIYAIGNLSIKSLSFLLLPLYTHLLTTSDFGIISLCSVYVSILSILFQLNFHGSLGRYYFKYVNTKQLVDLFGTTNIFLLFYGIVLISVSECFGTAVFAIITDELPYIPYGRLIVVTTFLSSTLLLVQTYYKTIEKPERYVYITIIAFVIKVFIIIYFVVYLKEGALGKLWGEFWGALILFIFTVALLFKLGKFNFSKPILFESLRFNIPLVPHSLATISMVMMNRVILAQYVSLEEVGIYSLGFQIGFIMELIVYSFNDAWTPFLYRVATEDKGAPNTLSRIALYYLIIVVSVSLSICVFSDIAVEIIAPQSYYRAVIIVPIIVLSFLFNGFYYMSVNQLLFAEKTGRTSFVTISAFLFNVVINIIFIPVWGIIGAAISNCITFFLLFILIHLVSQKVYPIPYSYRKMLQTIILACLVFGLSLITKVHSFWIDFAIKILLLFGFVVTLILFKLLQIQDFKWLTILRINKIP